MGSDRAVLAGNPFGEYTKEECASIYRFIEAQEAFHLALQDATDPPDADPAFVRAMQRRNDALAGLASVLRAELGPGRAEASYAISEAVRQIRSAASREWHRGIISAAEHQVVWRLAGAGITYRDTYYADAPLRAASPAGGAELVREDEREVIGAAANVVMRGMTEGESWPQFARRIVNAALTARAATPTDPAGAGTPGEEHEYETRGTQAVCTACGEQWPCTVAREEAISDIVRQVACQDAVRFETTSRERAERFGEWAREVSGSAFLNRLAADFRNLLSYSVARRSAAGSAEIPAGHVAVVVPHTVAHAIAAGSDMHRHVSVIEEACAAAVRVVPDAPATEEKPADD